MNYEVVSKEQFARMSRSNLFIDQGSFNKELYATSVDSIRRIVQSGKICVLTMNSTVSFEFCFICLLIMLVVGRQFQFIFNFTLFICWFCKGYAMFFTSWFYFIEFLLSFKLLFTVFKNSNYFLRYDRSKSGCITGFLWEAQSKTVNILKSL